MELRGFRSNRFANVKVDAEFVIDVALYFHSRLNTSVSFKQHSHAKVWIVLLSYPFFNIEDFRPVLTATVFMSADASYNRDLSLNNLGVCANVKAVPEVIVVLDFF